MLVLFKALVHKVDGSPFDQVALICQVTFSIRALSSSMLLGCMAKLRVDYI